MQATPSAPKADRPVIAILGVPFDSVTLAEVSEIATEMVASGRPHYATIVGVDFIVQSMEDVELRRILFDAHLVLAEDKPVIRAAKVLGNPLPENVTVPNLILRLLTLAEEKGWRVFVLGGEEPDKAIAEKIRARFPKLQLAGVYSPPPKPLLEMDHPDILRRLREARPDILLVAFGSPKQEKWINMNYREAGVPFVLGAGTTFNFLTGAADDSNLDNGENLWKFRLAVVRQWWRLRSKDSSTSVADASIIPDPYGNLIIRAPARLGAEEVRANQSEWLRAVENSHVLFDLTDTVFADSTGVGMLIRLRRRSRELGYQFFLISPRPPVEAALKLMKLDEFFTVQASIAGARILMESSAGAPSVISGVQEKSLNIRWSGEITALNAVEVGVHTESELSQVSPDMNVVIDLSRVTFVDSTGIGLMVRFKKNLKRRDINLKFINVSDSVRTVVRQTQLEEFLFGGN